MVEKREFERENIVIEWRICHRNQSQGRKVKCKRKKKKVKKKEKESEKERKRIYEESERH